MTDTADLDRLQTIVEDARRAGADAVDAILVSGVSLSVSQRLGEPEDLERAEGWDLGLRVLVGQRQAIVSSSDPSPEASAELISRAVAMATAVPEDPYIGLAEPDQLAGEVDDLDEVDPVEPDADALMERAARAEDAARAVEGVTNSEGAEASWSQSTIALAASNGFARQRAGSRHSVSVSVLAGEGTEMERDYDWVSAAHAEDLSDAAQVGRSAGENAVKRLGARKASTGQVPVVFDPRVANSLVRHLASAVSGDAVARGTTFLKDKMGEAIFADGISVIDDPLRRRGLRSKAFDAEGIATQRREVIADGRLATWIMDLRSARQLGLQTTGHASRGTGGPPSPGVTNLYLGAGTTSRDDLIGAIDDGFYVTEMMGFGVNNITGDYSRGASGFWIENGALAHPVSEVTIAGNLIEMFRNLTPADDLEFRYGINAPTTRIDGMTVAGT